MKYYRVKDEYITGQGNPDEEGIMTFPDGYIDDSIIKDNAYSVDSDGVVNLSEKYLSKRNLNRTDWKMIRHRDQLASGVATSLTDEEYQTLLTSRQSWREKASE